MLVQKNIASLLLYFTHFSPVWQFIQKPVIFLQSKTNDWFLYETQQWVEMGQWNICTSAFSHAFVGNKLMIKGCMINIHNINSGVIAFGLQIYLKKGTMAQVFSCEFCEISKNTFLQNTSGGCFWRYHDIMC